MKNAINAKQLWEHYCNTVAEDDFYPLSDLAYCMFWFWGGSYSHDDSEDGILQAIDRLGLCDEFAEVLANPFEYVQHLL